MRAEVPRYGLARSLLPLARVRKSAFERAPAQHESSGGSSASRSKGKKRLRRPTRNAIVLVHGYFGFDVLKLLFAQCEYFRGVRAHLEALGHEVHVVRVSPFGGIKLRAQELADQLANLGSDRVNVIAHSMGGLDARYAISALGLERKIASLVTVGTPHSGTPLADAMVDGGEWRWLKQLLDFLGRNEEGLSDLTTRKMLEFNRGVPNSPRVLYRSVVGALELGGPLSNPLFATPYNYLSRLAGLNDGFVPAESQRWGRVLRQVDADHIAQVGWSLSFDAQALYAGIADTLAVQGL